MGLSVPSHFKPVVGRFWRATFQGQEARLLSPARAPNGRWHHDGENALYLSATPEGCRVAVKAYQRPDDPPRVIFPLDVSAAHIVDLCAPSVRDALGMSLERIHVFWADLHAQGQFPPTWEISDQLRTAGAEGMLTPSRSRPELTHLTLFRWNENHAPAVRVAQNPIPF